MDKRLSTASLRWLIPACVCILLLGCGFTLNQPPAATANGTTNGSSVSGQASPAPSLSQALTGCSNPNTGVSNGDWGVGYDPVYTAVDNTAPVIGSPVYSANQVFWTSRENGPGQSILLTGAFTDAVKKARISFIPPGTMNWQSLVQGSATAVATIQQGTTGLSFTIPKTFPPGVYGFQLEDPTSPQTMGLANVPVVNWSIGLPSATGPDQALRHQIYDCGVEQGGTLRLFGKNFTAADQIVFRSSDGLTTAFKASKLDSNAITVTIPAGLPAGTYMAWVGTLPWSATSSPAVQINVIASPALRVVDMSCSQLVGDGATDNTNRLQACLDDYAPPQGAGDVITYITLPAGNFVLRGAVTAHPFEVLVGVSPTLTRFTGMPKGASPSAWFNVPQHFGMVNLSLTAPANPNLLLSTGTKNGNPALCGHLFFSNIRVVSTIDESNGLETLFAVGGPDIQVYDSYFLSNSNQSLDLFYADGAIVSRSEIVLNNWTGLAISDSQNVIFENNLTHSQNPPQEAPVTHLSGSGLSVTRANNQFGPSALSRNVYIGYNSFEAMGSADQQVITNDGDGGAYLGPVSASSADAVTLAADPAWNWMGTTNPEAAVMFIAFGTGVGQYSFIKGYSGRTINLENPWKVLPDQSSIVAITQYELNMTIAHNKIENTLGGAIVLGDALEGVVEDNSLSNAGQGILLSAMGPYGGPAAYGPMVNTDVLRNSITSGAGDLFAYDQGNFLWGIGISDFPGCLFSGLMVRNNSVADGEVVYNTDGVNGVTANVIEQNQAYWSPTFPTAGFLVQDNSPPPP